jgi:uncharacterized protein (TIGR02265 family)
MTEATSQTAQRPVSYVYRGKTTPNNGEQTATIKYNGIESILKGTKLDQNPAFLAEIRPFFDLKRPRKEYTLEIYFEVMDRVCDWLFPDLSRPAGREQVGRLMLEGFSTTVFGRIAMAGLNMMSPGRALMLTPNTFKNILNYGERTVTALAPNRYLFSSRGVAGTPEEQMGSIVAMLEKIGTQNPRCTVTVIDPKNWDYLFEWD